MQIRTLPYRNRTFESGQRKALTIFVGIGSPTGSSASLIDPRPSPTSTPRPSPNTIKLCPYPLAERELLIVPAAGRPRACIQ